MSNQYMDILKKNGINISKFNYPIYKERETYLENTDLYPIYKISKHTGTVVKFTSLTDGEVIHPDSRKHMSNSGWIKHTDYSIWRYLTEEEYHNHITSSKGLLDG